MTNHTNRQRSTIAIAACALFDLLDSASAALSLHVLYEAYCDERWSDLRAQASQHVTWYLKLRERALSSAHLDAALFYSIARAAELLIMAIDGDVQAVDDRCHDIIYFYDDQASD